MAKARTFIGDTATTTVIPAAEAKAEGWPYGTGLATTAADLPFVAPPLPPAEDLKKADEAKVVAPRKPRTAAPAAPKVAVVGESIQAVVINDFLNAANAVRAAGGAKRALEAALNDAELRIKIIRTVLGTA